MERVYWMDHMGKRILFSDYSNLTAEEIVATSAEADRELFPTYQYLPPGSVPALVDVTNALASKEAVAALKQSAKLWTSLYKRQAVIGLTAFQRVFPAAVNKFSGGNIVPFDCLSIPRKRRSSGGFKIEPVHWPAAYLKKIRAHCYGCPGTK